MTAPPLWGLVLRALVHREGRSSRNAMRHLFSVVQLHRVRGGPADMVVLMFEGPSRILLSMR